LTRGSSTETALLILLLLLLMLLLLPSLLALVDVVVAVVVVVVVVPGDHDEYAAEAAPAQGDVDDDGKVVRRFGRRDLTGGCGLTLSTRRMAARSPTRHASCSNVH
jgi:hypothetical protein